MDHTILTKRSEPVLINKNKRNIFALVFAFKCKTNLYENQGWLVGWLFGFYGISAFEGYLTPNPFLCK